MPQEMTSHLGETQTTADYYDAQATLYAELAEGASTPEECGRYRDEEHKWRTKAADVRRALGARTRLSPS